MLQGLPGEVRARRKRWIVPPYALGAPAPPPSVDSAAPPAPLDTASLLELGINTCGAVAAQNLADARRTQRLPATRHRWHRRVFPRRVHTARRFQRWGAILCCAPARTRVLPALLTNGAEEEGGAGPCPRKALSVGRSMRLWGPPRSLSALVVTIRTGYRRAVDAPSGAGEPSARV